MSSRTQFTETEALLIALDHGESDELTDYLIANFLPGELANLSRACRALSWSCGDVVNAVGLKARRRDTPDG